jgi:predicted nucleic acid-binding protein
MTDTLVDTNVLLDVVEEDAVWFDWSRRGLADAADEGAVIVNQVVYAELAAGYDTAESLDAMLHRDQFVREELPWDAAFVAGVAFFQYRRRGGRRSSPLPDFFIGAHAAVRGYTLLTRDRGYYATYFPTLKIVSPEISP